MSLSSLCMILFIYLSSLTYNTLPLYFFSMSSLFCRFHFDNYFDHQYMSSQSRSHIEKLSSLDCAIHSLWKCTSISARALHRDRGNKDSNAPLIKSHGMTFSSLCHHRWWWSHFVPFIINLISPKKMILWGSRCIVSGVSRNKGRLLKNNGSRFYKLGFCWKTFTTQILAQSKLTF
jgi:hypothetical protein